MRPKVGWHINKCLSPVPSMSVRLNTTYITLILEFSFRVCKICLNEVITEIIDSCLKIQSFMTKYRIMNAKKWRYESFNHVIKRQSYFFCNNYNCLIGHVLTILYTISTEFCSKHVTKKIRLY